jgi:Transposase
MDSFTPTIRPELLEELLKGTQKPEDIFGPEGLLHRLKGALMQRILEAEMSEHLGFEPNDPEGRGSGNSRNGYTDKTVQTETGPVPIRVPRDRCLGRFSLNDLEGIKAVAMDMWQPFIGTVSKLLPQADTKIVFDRFHIVAHMNKAVDIVRRRENRELRATGDERLVGSKHLWLYAAERVPEQSFDDFFALQRANLKTSRAWAIKETLRCLWDQPTREAGEAWYKHWHNWATHSRLQPVRKVAEMLRRHHARRALVLHTSDHQLRERGPELHHSDDQEASIRLPKLRKLPRRHPLSLRRPSATPMIRATRNPEESFCWLVVVKHAQARYQKRPRAAAVSSEEEPAFGPPGPTPAPRSTIPEEHVPRCSRRFTQWSRL